MTYVYPRLTRSRSLQLIESMDADGLIDDTLLEEARQECAPSPVGTPVLPAVIHSMRQAAMDAASRWNGVPLPRSEAAAWDAAVGAALHSSMEIVPSDAAHEDVWSYITLIELPDLAVHRFPERHENRMLGVPRNVFRRVWWRQEILGDQVAVEGVRPLGEDELVNIFERSRMSRNRDLARALAAEILRFRGSGRSEFARRLSLRVRALTGPRLLDVLEAEEVAAIIADISSDVQAEA